MDEQTSFWLKGGIVLLVVVGLSAGAVMTFSSGSIIGDTDDPNENTTSTPGEVNVNWNKFKSSIGMELPSQVNGENVVFIPEDVSPENLGSADVATIGADEDESDTTELFASSDVEENEDYYKYSTFGSKITTDLPDSGDYKVAVIGTGVGNVVYDVNIPENVEQLSRDNTVAINPLEGKTPDVLQYASDSDVTVQNTEVMDGDTTIAIGGGDFTSKADNDVDGTVTLRKEYEVADDRVVQLGEMSVSSVNTTNVDEVSLTVDADGEEVASESDTDFSDNEGLDDSVEFGVARAEDTMTVEMKVDFDDPAVTSSTDFATYSLDDLDADGDADDGSYGITAVSDTLTGY